MVPIEFRKKRLGKLIEFQNKITGELNEKEVGKTYRVLIESISKKRPTEYQGRGLNSRVVNFPIDTTEKKIGEFTMVKITESTKFSLKGVGEKNIL